MKELYFKLLGPISYKNSQGEYEQIIMEKQPLMLLSYFVLNHNSKISKDTLFDLFWPNSTNPENAIKFAIFRLRKALDKFEEFTGKEFIISSNGYYYIDKKFNIHLDIDEFNTILTDAKQNNDLKMYSEAINMYEGEFLYGLNFEYFNTYRTYYADQFSDISEFTSERYLHFMKYQECIEVCTKALRFEPFNERILLSYYEALIRNGKINEVYKHFEDTCKKAKKAKRDLSIKQGTIDELVKSAGNDSLIQIKDNELAYGPLIVDKKTFLSLMENDKRLKNRYGLNFHLFDFELKSNSINLPDFLNVLSLTLRRSDVICTDKNHVYSLSVLKKNDDIQVVYNRILVGMSLRFDKKDFEITYNCQSL